MHKFLKPLSRVGHHHHRRHIDHPPAQDKIVTELLKAERERLEKEHGVVRKTLQHFARPKENLFTRDQRETTTILFGGLTWKHDVLIQGMLEGLGYKCRALDTADVRAFQIGKEYGNNGQCNPTYFTVGNLVQELQKLESQGMSREDIINNYVSFTAGACGPCRFGMYEAEYRLALRNSGFDGFRVLIFQQTGGLNQAEIEAGLEMNLDFFLGILNAMNIGDLLNDLAYQIRPFEIEEGATDRALRESIELMKNKLKKRKLFNVTDKSLFKKLSFLKNPVESIGKFIDQLASDELVDAMKQCRDKFAQIKVDRLRVRPIVKITGEFWAQTTEGDGNFNMFSFLQREGAQVLVEPIATWIMYMLHQVKQEASDRKGLEIDKTKKGFARAVEKLKSNMNYRKRMAVFTLAEKLFKREYYRLRAALNDLPHALTDQYELQRIAHPYYNTRAEGGEGHLEVAKNIYYSSKDLCHMVLSVKPFGCMPSSQSDGVQSAVTSHYKDIIYLPVETSGEGEINAHSRMQMALGEARAKAKTEMKEILEQNNITMDELKTYVDDHSELQTATVKISHRKGAVSVAANFALHVMKLMNKQPIRVATKGE